MKINISDKIQQYQRDTQTISTNNTSVFRKIVVIIYKLLGRKVIAKLLISSGNCDSCTLCVNQCPNKAITLFIKNPRRSNRCKGCLWCVYICPKQVFELPIISLVGVFILLFLPFDEWILRLFSIHFTNISIQFMLSLLLWGIGYAISVFLFGKLIFLLSTFTFFKKVSKIPIIKKARFTLHPALVFPIIIPQNIKE